MRATRKPEALGPMSHATSAVPVKIMQNSAEHGRLSAAANDLLRSPRIRA